MKKLRRFFLHCKIIDSEKSFHLNHQTFPISFIDDIFTYKLQEGISDLKNVEFLMDLAELSDVERLTAFKGFIDPLKGL